MQLTPIENNQIAIHLLGQPNKKFSHNNSLRFGKKGSKIVDINKGVYYDFELNQGGNLISLVQEKYACQDKKSLKAELKNICNYSNSDFDINYQNNSYEISREEKTRWAWDVWKSGRDISGTPAFKYLNKFRCIPERSLLSTGSLKFGFTRKPYFDWGDEYPALLAAITDKNGYFKGVHITFIKPDGLGKLFAKNSKYIAGSGIKSCSIVLGNNLENVVVAEGIESALSVASIYGQTPISTISAGGMVDWVVPDGVKTITFAPDMDDAGTGYSATQKSATKQFVKGYEIKGFLCPPHGCNDWNDALVAHGNGGYKNV